MANWIPGAKTYLGIALTMFGTVAQMLGWDWWAAIGGDVQTIANQILAVVGLAVATYGRAVAKPK